MSPINCLRIPLSLFFLLTFFCLSTVNQDVFGQQRRFDSSGAFNIRNLFPDLEPGESVIADIRVIIVGGGGGGGRGQGAGGGGGGEVLILEISVDEEDFFDITIGEGGQGATNPNGDGGNGSSTFFDGIEARGGLGGRGGLQGNGGDSGSGNVGGNADTPNGTGNQTRRAGGGGAGSSISGNGSGIDGNSDSPGRAGNGGLGRLGFGGGGGGAGRQNGGDNNNQNNAQGIGQDGGSNGSRGSAGPATNGGGGGGGWNAGGRGGNGLVQIEVLNFSILPVEYLYFDANFRRQERWVELRWATAKEWENSHFEVERAVNQVRNWETIGQVEGAGFSDAPVSYEFKDKQVPLVGGNVFYRLKQVDFDGTFAYSKVVSARVPGIEVTNGVWRAFPNPTDGQNFRVSLIDRSQYDDEAITFRLVHPMVFTPPQTVASESEMNAGIEELVRKMPKGVFVVEIQWGRKVEHIKILKR